MFLRWLIGRRRPVLARPPECTSIPCTHAADDGEICVHVPEGARPPVRVHWRGIDRSHVSADTLRATGLRPGWYSLHVEDADGATSGAVNVKVESRQLPVISGYEVTHASADDMADGSIELVCDQLMGVDAECLVLWSNGAMTVGRALSGVRPGTYAAWIVEIDGELTSCVHACRPVRVGVE